MKIFINYQLMHELKEARKRQLIESVSQLMDLGMNHKQALNLVISMSQDLDDNWDELKNICFGRQTGNFNETCKLPSFDWYRVL